MTDKERIEKLTAALELFIQTVNPPYPQNMALWQEHLKAATENARKVVAATAAVDPNIMYPGKDPDFVFPQEN